MLIHRFFVTTSRQLLVLAIFSAAFIAEPIADAQTAPAVPAAPLQIVLTNGDVLTGVVIDESALFVTLEHPALGILQIERARISTARPTPTAAEGTAGEAVEEESQASETAEPAVAPSAPDEVAATDEKTGAWASHLELAASLTDGNSENSNFRIGITSEREDDDDRTQLDTSFFWASTDGDQEENRFTAGLLQDWFVPDSPWLWFADARYDYDEFQSWDHRVNAHFGPGYELIRKENLELTLRAGLGAIKEWGSDDESVRPEALLGADFRWKVNDRQDFEASTRIFPDLGDLGEFRNVNRLGWIYKLADDSNLALNAGLEHEYQSSVDEGIEKNDLRLYAGLQLDF